MLEPALIIIAQGTRFVNPFFHFPTDFFFLPAAAAQQQLWQNCKILKFLCT